MVLESIQLLPQHYSATSLPPVVDENHVASSNCWWEDVVQVKTLWAPMVQTML